MVGHHEAPTVMPPRSAALLVASIWPEVTTAAGVRTLGLVSTLLSGGYEVHVCSPAARLRPHANCSFAVFHGHGTGVQAGDGRSARLKGMGVAGTHSCPPNDPAGFALALRQTDPAICVFDRFFMEEQFGWQVRDSKHRSCNQYGVPIRNRNVIPLWVGGGGGCRWSRASRAASECWTRRTCTSCDRPGLLPNCCGASPLVVLCHKGCD